MSTKGVKEKSYAFSDSNTSAKRTKEKSNVFYDLNVYTKRAKEKSNVFVIQMHLLNEQKRNALVVNYGGVIVFLHGILLLKQIVMSHKKKKKILCLKRN